MEVHGRTQAQLEWLGLPACSREWRSTCWSFSGAFGVSVPPQLTRIDRRQLPTFQA